MVTLAAKRNAVAHLKEAFRTSERRACEAIGCCRAGLRKRKVNQLIEDDEVHPGLMLGEPAVAGLGLEPIDNLTTL